MVRRHYEVAKNNYSYSTVKDDNSFSMCIVTILFFFLACLLIVAFPWLIQMITSSNQGKNGSSHEKMESASRVKADEDKIKLFTTNSPITEEKNNEETTKTKHEAYSSRRTTNEAYSSKITSETYSSEKITTNEAHYPKIMTTSTSTVTKEITNAPTGKLFSYENTEEISGTTVIPSELESTTNVVSVTSEFISKQSSTLENTLSVSIGAEFLTEISSSTTNNSSVTEFSNLTTEISIINDTTTISTTEKTDENFRNYDNSDPPTSYEEVETSTEASSTEYNEPTSIVSTDGNVDYEHDYDEIISTTDDLMQSTTSDNLVNSETTISDTELLFSPKSDKIYEKLISLSTTTDRNYDISTSTNVDISSEETSELITTSDEKENSPASNNIGTEFYSETTYKSSVESSEINTTPSMYEHTIESSSIPPNVNESTTVTTEVVPLSTNEGTVSNHTSLFENLTKESTTSNVEHTIEEDVKSTVGCTTIINVVHETTTPIPGPKKCETNLCKIESSRMLSFMNHSSDYCQDFYEYACGGLRHSRVLTEDSLEDVVMTKISDEVDNISKSSFDWQKSLKAFYDSCLRFEHIPLKRRKATARRLLSSVGEFMPEEGVVTNFTQTVAHLILLDSFPIFEVGFDIDQYNDRKLVMTLTVPLKKYLFNQDDEKEKRCRNVLQEKIRRLNKIDLSSVYSNNYLSCMKNHSEYIETIGDALHDIDVFKNHSYSSAFIQKIQMAVEDKLLHLQENLPLIGRIKTVKSEQSEKFSIKRLQGEYGMIDWKQLFNILTKEYISDDTQVHIFVKSYFDSVFEVLSDTKELWKMHNSLLAHLAYNLYKNFVKPSINIYCRRKTYCLKITSLLMPDAVSNLFMSSFSPAELYNRHNEIMKLYEEIKGTLIEEVDEAKSLPWLDESSSDAILKKISAVKVIFPSELNVDAEMNLVKYHLEDCYFTNSMLLMRRKQALYYSMYTMDSQSPYVLWMLFSKSFGTTPDYIYRINTLVIPEAVILNYDKNTLDSLTMGRFGHLLARGLAQAFDKRGIYYNYKNEYGLILSHKSYSEYNLLILMNADNLFGYTQSHTEDEIIYSFQLVSDLTLNERLSDVSATKLAIETLKRNRKFSEVLPWGKFTSEQIYFLSVAQTFCSKRSIQETFPSLFEDVTLLPFLRIRSMFSNSEDFSTSFPCPTGSTMNSLVKIDAFPVLQNEYYDY